jgi:hypothetical protein
MKIPQPYTFNPEGVMNVRQAIDRLQRESKFFSAAATAFGLSLLLSNSMFELSDPVRGVLGLITLTAIALSIYHIIQGIILLVRQGRERVKFYETYVDELSENIELGK